MGSQEFLNICKTKVAEYSNVRRDKTDVTPELTTEDPYVGGWC